MADFITINSGRARVIVNVEDDSFVTLITEDAGQHISAFIPEEHGIVTALGNTAERDQGFLEVPNLDDWTKRLRDNTFGILESTGAGITYSSPEDTGASKLDIKKDWYSVQNYLLYGGSAIVGFTASDFQARPIDSVFCTSEDNIPTTLAVPSERGGDCVAVVPSGGTGSSFVIGFTPTIGDSPFSENKIAVYGTKVHLGFERKSTVSDVSADLIETSCAADVAGCLARTDARFQPFFSPAGFTRGRILDVVKLKHTLTQANQDTLYDAGINPIVTFPGEGTFLFGDKTFKATTSTLSRINVSRLFVTLKRDIGRIARSILFEQNDVETRTNFVSRASAVLRGIQADRGIFDFRLVCDETNNPPEKAEANIFVADVFVKPIKYINFIQLTFTNKNQDADLGSSPA